ncbi:hypothetical protein D3C81_802120 [compost metagenome]
MSGKAGADAIEHWITAGQDADGLATSGQDRFKGKGTWPHLPFATDAGWQQIQLSLTANDPRSLQQSMSGIFSKPLEAFLSDAYYCQPGGHAVPHLSIEAKSRSRSVPGWRLRIIPRRGIRLLSSGEGVLLTVMTPFKCQDIQSYDGLRSSNLFMVISRSFFSISGFLFSSLYLSSLRLARRWVICAS